METINDRMEMLVNERFGGNKAAFAKAIDLAPTAISSYLGTKRRSKPSVEMITNIVTKLNVDAYWLLTGEKREQDNVAVNGSHNQVNGDGAHGNINGASIDVAVLEERIKSMQQLLEEKERTIKILMGK